ncbi:MAG: hypothetical protein AABZ39_00600 [Spirochaetota bacterium]
MKGERGLTAFTIITVLFVLAVGAGYFVQKVRYHDDVMSMKRLAARLSDLRDENSKLLSRIHTLSSSKRLSALAPGLKLTAADEGAIVYLSIEPVAPLVMTRQKDKNFFQKLAGIFVSAPVAKANEIHDRREDTRREP